MIDIKRRNWSYKQVPSLPQAGLESAITYRSKCEDPNSKCVKKEGGTPLCYPDLFANSNRPFEGYHE